MAKRSSVRTIAPTRGAVVVICTVLTAITCLVFGQTLRHQFVTYDDPQYVYANPDVTAGVSPARIAWAFTHTIAGNWHPLTTISHMLDCQLYGLNPAGHHFTNVLLHTIAVILLFLVLRQMTGNLWRSAFVAVLFAIHPLHVESVAWISERKDALSAVFFMFTLGAYVRYVRANSLTAYLLVLLFFALGLMSKPMLVTLPFILLLLDYWPLERIGSPGLANPMVRQAARSRQSSTITRLIVEKIPLLALSAVFSVVTLLGQFHSTGISNQLPLAWRLSNAVVSYVVYIWQMFWPVRLAAFYPHPHDQLLPWQVFLAIAFLVAITVLAIHLREQRGYVFTGWFWYLGMLVPVIGLVQAGEQARADRYTYLPQIGLYVLITWGITDLVLSMAARRPGWGLVPAASPPASFRSHKTRAASSAAPPHRRRSNPSSGYKALCAAIAIAIIAPLSWRAFVQTSFWKDSEILWKHTLAVTSDNDVAHYNLGYLFLQRGDSDSAISHFETALRIRSRNRAGHYDFGGAPIENNLANILAQKGRINEAIDHYHNAMRLRPGYGDPYLNLGNLLVRQGRMSDAIALWQQARATESKDARFHTTLADAFLRAGLQKDAVAEYEYAAGISTQDPLPRNNLAWLLATSRDASIRDGTRALELANEALGLSNSKDPNFLRTLAAANAESGRFAEAEETARKALRAAERLDNRTLVSALHDEIALYELGLPYHR
jgi:protein O-mannosyl-transferase